MKKLILAFWLLSCLSVANAQDIPAHSIPIGEGPGAVGWGSAAPGSSGNVLQSNGPSSDPGFNPLLSSSVTFTQQGTGAVSLTVGAKLSQSINTADFGAVCDGSTDDTTHLQNAINQAISGNVPLLIQESVAGCKITSALTISAPITIIGYGHVQSTIALGNTTQNGFLITSQNPVYFYNFGITALGTQTAGAGIKVDPGATFQNLESKFIGLRFIGLWEGLDFERAASWTVLDSKFINILEKSIIVRNLTNVDHGDGTISHCQFQQAATANSGNINIYQESSGGLRILNNKFNASWDGYELNLASGAFTSILLIDGNSFDNIANAGVLLTTQTPAAGQFRFANIISNQFNMAANSGVSGIKITASSTPLWLLDVAIDGNSFLDNATSSSAFGINIDNVTNVSITGNAFEDTSGTAFGINITSAASLVTISDSNAYRNFALNKNYTNASTSTLIQDGSGLAFASLPTAAANGSRIFLTDGTPGTAPCTGSGTGSTAFRQNGAWVCPPTTSGGSANFPTQQQLLSGSGATYTTPTSPTTPRLLVVRECGAGGGGGGAGSAAATAGGTGGTTTFNSINAVGGSGGALSNNSGVSAQGAAGGTGGTGTATFRQRGSDGSPSMTGSGTNNTPGGTGGSGWNGNGAGRGQQAGAGIAGGTNSCAGGGGGAGGTGNGQTGGGGGAAGEYAEIRITSPAATYTYTVGAAGTAGGAGTGGNAGGAGGTGFILVDEYY